MSARSLLADALDVFEQRPTAHTTGALARDMNSHPVAATNPLAVCWCSHGILLKGAGTGSLGKPTVAQASDLLQLAAVELGHLSVTRCNDALGRNGAIAMLRRAICLHDEGLPKRALALVPEGSTA